MSHKRLLVESLLNELPAEQKMSVQQAITLWFYNIRSSGGFRLTDAGLEALACDLKLETYEYEIPESTSITQHTLLALDRKLTMPYYIVIKKHIPVSLILFGEKEAFFLKLNKDLERFLQLYP